MFRLCLLLCAGALSACAAPAAVRPTAAENAAAARAYRDARVTRSARPPKLGLPTVRVSPDHALGNPAARLAIVEFADYQCPYCRAFHAATFPRLRAAYIRTGKARYFYKDFPLPMHAHALGASVAAYCAGRQGHYWRMQDLLYADQPRLGAVLYVELARKLRLDVARFNVCRRSAAARAAVHRDFRDGRRLGIDATPSFVLGRVEGDHVVVERMASGIPTFKTFAHELDTLSGEKAALH